MEESLLTSLIMIIVNRYLVCFSKFRYHTTISLINIPIDLPRLIHVKRSKTEFTKATQTHPSSIMFPTSQTSVFPQKNIPDSRGYSRSSPVFRWFYPCFPNLSPRWRTRQVISPPGTTPRTSCACCAWRPGASPGASAKPATPRGANGGRRGPRSGRRWMPWIQRDKGGPWRLGLDG